MRDESMWLVFRVPRSRQGRYGLHWLIGPGTKLRTMFGIGVQKRPIHSTTPYRIYFKFDSHPAELAVDFAAVAQC